MNSYLDKLNLRPQERRLVVVVAVVVFVVVNLIWVVPQFGQVEFWGNRKRTSEETLRKYTGEIGRVKAYSNELAALQSQGVTIGNDDPTLSLQRDVSSLASMSSVQIELNSPVQRVARTNSLFEEAGMRITVTALETNLVEFLYNLGARNTLIRVRTMSLQPDPSQTRLKGTLEFVQSFLKKAGKAGASSAPGPKTPKVPSGAMAKAPPMAVPGTNTARAPAAAAAKPPPSTNWFKKLLAKVTGRSSPKPAATNTTTKPLRPSPVKTTFKTNTAPPVPAPPAPK